ncbi:MAG TPA: ester cyclase [Terracidiphilus sp.]|nr:ester cyclase [Terracidiphilus sp.]
MQNDTRNLWKMDLEFWNSGNAERAREVYAPKAVHREPGSKPILGPKHIAERVARLRYAFPDFQLRFNSTHIHGDQFVLSWTSTGTHKGEFQGVPPTGKRIEIQGVSVGHIENGRIRDEDLYYDRLAFLEQTGVPPVLPHPEEPAMTLETTAPVVVR